MKWFKFYGQDWLTDLKVINMSIEDRLCFITLLCLASSSETQGLIKNCDEESLIKLTHLHDNPYDTDNEYCRAKGCLERYKVLKIVMVAHNGDITLRNFGKRQGENMSNAERQKAYRTRLRMKKQEKENVATRYNNHNARIDKNRKEEINTGPRDASKEAKDTNPNSPRYGMQSIAVAAERYKIRNL